MADPTPQIFIEGLDPTGETQISASQLLQMIRQAVPNDANGIGILISSTAEPSTDDFPATLLNKAIWIDDDQALYRRDSSTGDWNPIQIPTEGITSAGQIANGIITINKLYAPSGAGLFVLRVNVDSNAFELVAAGSIFSDGTIGVTKLDADGATDSFLYVDGDGLIQWAALNLTARINALTNLISPNILSVATGGADALKLLRVAAGGTSKEWATLSDILTNQSVPLAALVSGGVGNANKSIRVNGSTGLFELYTPNNGVSFYKTPDVSLEAIPTTDATYVRFPHGLGAQPSQCWVVAVCQTPEQGYVAGNELFFPLIYNQNSNYVSPLVYADSTYVWIPPFNWSTYNSSWVVWSVSTPGSLVSLTPANWKFRAYATLYPSS